MRTHRFEPKAGVHAKGHMRFLPSFCLSGSLRLRQGRRQSVADDRAVINLPVHHAHVMELLPFLDSVWNNRLMGLYELDQPLLGRCGSVMKIWYLLGPLFVIFYHSGALAQETLDVDKVTCEQFVSGELADSRSISIWLYGYYSGMRKNSVIDVLAVQEFEQSLIHFCLSNTNMPISEASNKILGAQK
jgi:hypothetical protein